MESPLPNNGVFRLRLPCTDQTQFEADFAKKAARRMFVPMPTPLPVGAEFELQLKFSDGQVRVRGIARVKESLLAPKPGVKAQFISLSPESIQFPLETVPPPAPPDAFDDLVGEPTGVSPMPGAPAPGASPAPFPIEPFEGPPAIASPEPSAVAPPPVSPGPSLAGEAPPPPASAEPSAIGEAPPPPLASPEPFPPAGEFARPTPPTPIPTGLLKVLAPWQSSISSVPSPAPSAPTRDKEVPRPTPPRAASAAVLATLAEHAPKPDLPLAIPLPRKDIVERVVVKVEVPAPRGRLRLYLDLAAAALLALGVGAWQLAERRAGDRSLEQQLTLFDQRFSSSQLSGPGGDTALDHLLAGRAVSANDPRLAARTRQLAEVFELLSRKALERGDDAEAAVHLQALLLTDPNRPGVAQQLKDTEARVRDRVRTRK